MKKLLLMVAVTVPLLDAGDTLAQTGHMMDGGMGGFGWMGGYGGVVVSLLLLIVVVGLVAWILKQKGK